MEWEIEKAYFGNHCFSIFTVCCYTKSLNNNDVRNDVIVVTKSFNHDRVPSVSFLQKVVHRIEHMQQKMYQNVYVWSGGMGPQFGSCWVFILLASTVLLGKTLS